MGKLKDELLKKFHSHIPQGEKVLVPEVLVYPSHNWRTKNIWMSVVSDNGDTVTVKNKDVEVTIPRKDVVRKDDHIGVNPLPESSWNDGMSKHDFTLGWFLDNKGTVFTTSDGTEIKGLNFDPYIKDVNGNKIHYQRELCWTLEQKFDFIESLYKELNCGVVIVKCNSDDDVKECGCEYDIIDGKQRIHTLIEFFNDEITDRNGNFWSDFSDVARRHFKNISCFETFMFGYKTPDSKIKQAFINVNHKGTPVSNEHIEFVKSIQV